MKIRQRTIKTIVTAFGCCFMVLFVSGMAAYGQYDSETGDRIQADAEDILSEPVVAGYGEGLFRIGERIYADDFENLDNWVVQIQESDAEHEPTVLTNEGTLDVLMPGRGATIWNREKFSGPVAIVYNVKAPSEYTHKAGVMARDINCFWHASDAVTPSDVLNSDRYTGAFGTYDKQYGYYASMGGGQNTTTRFRHYPRRSDGEPVDHLALTDKDGLEEYLIEPDRIYTIQLVAFNDVIQYIVDGRIFYEIREGDTVAMEKADGGVEKVVYTRERFPPYEQGWFGFRLVNTHHVYSDFRVYRLEPVD